MKLKFMEKIIITIILLVLFSCKSTSLNGKWVSLEDGCFSNISLDIHDNQFKITNLPSTLYMPDEDSGESIIFFDPNDTANKNGFDINKLEENVTFSDADGIINKNEMSFVIDNYKVNMSIIYCNLSQGELTLIFENGLVMDFVKDEKK